MRIRLNQQIRSYNDYANFRVCSDCALIKSCCPLSKALSFLSVDWPNSLCPKVNVLSFPSVACCPLANASKVLDDSAWDLAMSINNISIREGGRLAGEGA